ncbi:MAG: M28 family peptidase [Longimicrobiales bacterium]|jgi:acetylornithine deacetylase/succinyl-diaminopimelate desuccinylase-like protein
MNLRLWIVTVVGLGLVVSAPFLTRRDATSPGAQYGVGMGAVQPLGDTIPDIDRLMATVRTLAHDSMAGREAGSNTNVAVARWLTDSLGRLGIAPAAEEYRMPFAWAEGSGVNVLGRIRGTEGASLIVLTAHFDHIGVRDGEIYNGADDNASGTAAVLELARLLVEQPPEADVLVAFLDAEEVGLQGARALVARPPEPFPAATVNVNLDMVSRSGGILWAAGAHHTPALRPVLEAVAAEAPATLRLGHDRPDAPEGDDWTSASDHRPFHEAGIPFVYFGVEDHPDYHRPTDDVELIVPSEFEASVRTIYAAIRALDAALPLVTEP